MSEYIIQLSRDKPRSTLKHIVVQLQHNFEHTNYIYLTYGLHYIYALYVAMDFFLLQPRVLQ